MNRRALNEPDEAYVQARRVLIDALEALGSQRKAVILAGAQAIYLQTGKSRLPVAEYTTDGDLTIDQAELADAPSLEKLMEGGKGSNSRGSAASSSLGYGKSQCQSGASR